MDRLKKEYIEFARGNGNGGHDFSERELRSLEIIILADIANSLECIAGKHNEGIYNAGYEEGRIDGYDELQREKD